MVPPVLDPRAPLALYMEGSLTGRSGKMGFGVLRYSPNPVVAVVDSTQAGRDASEFGPWRSCPVVATIEEARAIGATTLVLGIAPLGGMIPAAWYADLDKAVDLGMGLVNGLHDKLGPRYAGKTIPGQIIWDLRQEPPGLSSGTGAAAKLPGVRLLLVGTDMAVGKMTAGLEIYRAALADGISAAFVATGQIGITITGAGVPLDAIRVDFASGAIEREVVRASEKGARLIVVEGQGSLVHPGSTANLPLLRGACPTHLILCARAGQTYLREATHIAIPPLRSLISLYERLGEAVGAFARPKTVAVALNTSGLTPAQAEAASRETSDATALPCFDPIRDGAEGLLATLPLA